MTILARRLLLPLRTLTLGVVCSLATVLATLALAPGASAFVTEVGGTSVGLQPRNQSTLFDGTLAENELNEWSYNPSPESFDNPNGNPVLHGTNVYAIYWDPTAHYHNDWKALIDEFFQNAGIASGSLNTVFSVDEQYTDKTNIPASSGLTFRGAYSDTALYPAAGCEDPAPLKKYEPFKTGPITCLTDEQLKAQLTSFIEAHGLTKGMHSIFYLLTPPGVTVCLDAGGAAGHCSDFDASEEEFETEQFESLTYQQSFCSYHSYMNPGGLKTGDESTVLYGVVPWTAGGVRDGQLNPVDQLEAPYCQDGGFDPVSHPIEEHESAKALSEEEEKKYEEMTKTEKEKFDEAQLGRPHDQEPNQVPCPSPDGYCDTGLADLIINQLAVEQQNIVTNPLLESWQDENHNEAVDECRNFFAPATGNATANPESGAGFLANQFLGAGQYYLNDAFNLASLRLNYPGIFCVNGLTLQPKFTAPSPVATGDIVAFDGGESNVTLDAAIGYSAGGAEQSNYATYTWSFGDGTPEVSGYAPGSPPCEAPWLPTCAESVFHSYQQPGTYPVTLTIKDVGGNVASATHSVTVSGKASGGEGGEGGEGGGGSGGGSGSSSSSSSNTTNGSSPSNGSNANANGTNPSVLPAPMLTVKVLSRSLASVMRRGIAVRYSVNEQVAGHFEVLLGKKIAHKLKIGGASATGMPAGSEPQVVIAKALLITIKGGKSTVHIILSKRTAERLRNVKKVGLGLRLTVRNAATVNPATATLVSAFTLHR